MMAGGMNALMKIEGTGTYRIEIETGVQPENLTITLCQFYQK